MKEEALKLADEIDNFLKEEEQLPWGTKQVYLDMASTMIRRLVEELDKQWYMVNKDGYVKPLSDEEIMKLLNGIEYSQAEVETSFDYEIRIARAIEERHGIKNVQKT